GSRLHPPPCSLPLYQPTPERELCIRSITSRKSACLSLSRSLQLSPCLLCTPSLSLSLSLTHIPSPLPFSHYLTPCPSLSLSFFPPLLSHCPAHPLSFPLSLHVFLFFLPLTPPPLSLSL